MDKIIGKNGLIITESLNIMSQQSQTNSVLNQVLVDATNESLTSLGNINKDINIAIIPVQSPPKTVPEFKLDKKERNGSS